MKKISGIVVLVVVSLILLGSSQPIAENNSSSKNVISECPYLNKIHSNIDKNLNSEDKSECPYLNSQKKQIENNGTCPYQEKQNKIHYEMNKKRAAEKIKLS
jgi:hypothetical protein